MSSRENFQVSPRFNIYLSRYLTSISSHKQSCALLQRLPAEIRTQIYEYVLGHKVIHIGTRDCPWGDKGAWPYEKYYRYQG